MKAKWIGLLLLIVVALGAVGYVWFSQTTQVTEITGYVGGEKIGLLEDEQVQKILKDKYRLSLDYNRAGSIEMVTTLDRTGQDFLFPSNQTALELFEGEVGSPEKSQIVFNTPIVLYTHAAVAEALTAEGVFSQSGGVLTADMEQLVELMESGAQWSDVGLPELYGSVTWAPPTRLSPTPATCSPGCWPTSSAAAPWGRRTCRSCCPGSRPCSRSWGTWRAPPRTCSTSF